jgi:hypothetical protein
MSVSLGGTVVDGITLDPIVGADVSAYDAAGAVYLDHAITDGSGVYALSLAAGVVKLKIVAAGYADTWFNSGTFTGASDIVLVAAAVTVDVALFVTPATGFGLGGVPVWVGDATAFERPAFTQRVPLLNPSAGSGSFSEALQSSTLPRRSATWSLPWVPDALLTQLSDWFKYTSNIYCQTPLVNLYVVIFDLPAAQMVTPGLWTITGMVLLEAPEIYS